MERLDSTLGPSGILWISTASLTHAAQPLPQELMNQWFPVEVLSGARIPLSIDSCLSPWSLIRLRLAPDERLLVLFNAPVQDCTISGDARLDPDRGRIHIRSHAITCRTLKDLKLESSLERWFLKLTGIKGSRCHWHIKARTRRDTSSQPEYKAPWSSSHTTLLHASRLLPPLASKISAALWLTVAAAHSWCSH
jgi:hypothetical protein